MDGDRPIDSGGTELIGRESELTRLRDIADLSVEHGAQLAIVSGEAGIGKTTLITEVFSELAAGGWGTHVGYCIEYTDRSLPFGPIVNVLRSVLLDDRDALDQMTDGHRQDLAGVLPELDDHGTAPVPLAGDVDRLFDAITTTLASAATPRPIAVLIEDIHWADGATRDLISVLTHGLGPARVLLLITERTAALDRSHPLRTWLAESRRLANVHSLELDGLTSDELARQAERVLGELPVQSYVDELMERTGGNPFFSHELLMARRAGDRLLPTSLVEFVGSRIGRLDDDERSLLRCLAIAGGTADHRLLAQMAPNLDVAATVRSLFDSSVLVLDGNEFTFAHALLRDAILADVLPFEAEELHRSAAEAMLADPRRVQTVSDMASLALHWIGANDADRSLVTTIDAARAAAAVAAFDSAADMALQALESWPAASDPVNLTGLQREQLLLDAAEWLASCYRGEEAIDLITSALAGWANAINHSSRALLLSRMAPIQWHLGNPSEATRLLTEADRLVRGEESAEAAQVHHRLSKQALADGQIHPALASAERAIEIAENHGPLVILIEAMTAKALAIGVTVDLNQGVELVRQARAMALAEQLVSQVANTYRTEMLVNVFRAGRTEAALDASREGLRYAEQHCGPRWRAEFRLDLCLGYVEGGRLNRAEPLFEVLLSSELDDLRRLTVLQIAGQHALANDLTKNAETFLSAAIEIADRYQSAQETGFQWRLEAELARRQGQLDDALRLIDRALELQLAGDNLTYTRDSIVEKIRVLRSWADHGREVEQLVDTTQQLVDRFSGPGLANRAMKALMELELTAVDGPVGQRQATETIAMVESAGFLYEAALARIIQIESELTLGPTDRLRLAELVRELHQLATTHGMEWIEVRAKSLAKIARVKLDNGSAPTPVASGSSHEYPHHLTTREVEVMALLAEGLTNKAIGERLYVSPRTVSTHISNLLAKIGAANRGEAAAAYHRLGLAQVIDLRDPVETEPTRERASAD